MKQMDPILGIVSDIGVWDFSRQMAGSLFIYLFKYFLCSVSLCFFVLFFSASIVR
jgi:hypothetical protein